MNDDYIVQDIGATPSVRPLARHFLSESLPFADCPKEDCSNHGFNGFEHCSRGARGRPSRYLKSRAHQLTCSRCKTTFSLGVSRGMHARTLSEIKADIRQLLHSVAMGRTVKDAIDSGLGRVPYYRHLFRFTGRQRGYVAYRNAFLLKPGFCDQESQTVSVYTDVVQVSEQQPARDKEEDMPDRFWHVGINVTDMDRSSEFYEKVGFKIVSSGIVKNPATGKAFQIPGGRRLLFAKDPDGTVFHFVQFVGDHSAH